MRINGKELIISPASFDEAMNLQDAILKSVHDNKIKFDFMNDNDLDSILDDKNDNEDDVLNKVNISSDLIGDFINTIISIGMSKAVRKNLFICAERAVFGKKKEYITKEFFENTENREYYFSIMIEVMKVNLTPFFKGLFSQYGEVLQNLKSFLK
jgi:hypothetical protein